uniref:Vestigial like family member 4 n=1 Tax=Sus scrofa TaxID=9823 RepID=A0A4X1UKQ8_PIG
MLFMKMDLLNYQYLDKMNNNIGILCYEGEAALRGEPRLQTLPVASALTGHRTGPPPISPSKRKFSVEPGDDDLDCEGDHASKMSRIFAPHLSKTANGDCRKDPRERSRSPIERAAAPTMSLHGSHLYTSLPSLSMEQPLALTKNSLDTSRPAGISPTLTPVERQQPPPPVTPWWRSISAGAWARTTRSLSRHPTPCPSQALWTTTLPKPWATHGCRSRQPRTAHPAAPSRPRAGASPPAPLRTWSATATPHPWSPEGALPANMMRICMVCLSFEQSVLKKWGGAGGVTGVGWEEGRGGLFAKP